MKNNFSMMLIGVSALMLAGCGGSNKPDGGSSPSPTINEAQSRRIAVNIDTSVPNGIVTSVERISTSQGFYRRGEQASVLSNDQGTDVVLAMDAENNLLLGGVVSSAVELTAITLNSETTAQLLLRLSLGAMGDNIPLEKLFAHYKSSSSYQNLIRSIESSLDNNKSPATDAATVKSMMEVHASLRNYDFTQAALPAKIREKKQVLNGVEAAPVPYKIFPSSFDLWGENLVVYVNDGSSSGKVAVQNAMPLTWNIQTKTHQGNLISTKQGLDVGGTNFLPLLLGKLVPWDVLEKSDVPSGDGSGFYLTASQTEDTQRENSLRILTETIGLVIGLYSPNSNKCAKEFAKSFLSDRFDKFAENLNAEDFFNELGAWSVDPKNFISILESCHELDPNSSGSINWENFERRIKTVTKHMAFVAKVLDLVDASSLAARAVLLMHHFNDSYTVSVCQGLRDDKWSGQPEARSRVSSCARTLRLEKPLFTMAKGAVATPKISAFDIQGNPTLIPRKLVFEKLGGFDADPFKFNPLTAEVTATSFGTSGVKFVDEATSAHVTLGVIVTNPVLLPQNPKISVGEMLLFSIKAPNGESIILPAGITFKSSDESVIQPLPTGHFVAKKAGKATASARNPVTDELYSTEVEVFESHPIVVVKDISCIPIFYDIQLKKPCAAISSTCLPNGHLIRAKGTASGQVASQFGIVRQTPNFFGTTTNNGLNWVRCTSWKGNGAGGVFSDSNFIPNGSTTSYPDSSCSRLAEQAETTEWELISLASKGTFGLLPTSQIYGDIRWTYDQKEFKSVVCD